MARQVLLTRAVEIVGGYELMEGFHEVGRSCSPRDGYKWCDLWSIQRSAENILPCFFQLVYDSGSAEIEVILEAIADNPGRLARPEDPVKVACLGWHEWPVLHSELLNFEDLLLNDGQMRLALRMLGRRSPLLEVQLADTKQIRVFTREKERAWWLRHLAASGLLEIDPGNAVSWYNYRRRTSPQLEEQRAQLIAALGGPNQDGAEELWH